jgi:hypothetical protein
MTESDKNVALLMPVLVSVKISLNKYYLYLNELNLKYKEDY